MVETAKHPKSIDPAALKGQEEAKKAFPDEERYYRISHVKIALITLALLLATAAAIISPINSIVIRNQTNELTKTQSCITDLIIASQEVSVVRTKLANKDLAAQLKYDYVVAHTSDTGTKLAAFKVLKLTLKADDKIRNNIPIITSLSDCDSTIKLPNFNSNPSTSTLPQKPTSSSVSGSKTASIGSQSHTQPLVSPTPTPSTAKTTVTRTATHTPSPKTHTVTHTAPATSSPRASPTSTKTCVISILAGRICV